VKSFNRCVSAMAARLWRQCSYQRAGQQAANSERNQQRGRRESRDRRRKEAMFASRLNSDITGAPLLRDIPYRLIQGVERNGADAGYDSNQRRQDKPLRRAVKWAKKLQNLCATLAD
jgi:hypothetical protein